MEPAKRVRRGTEKRQKTTLVGFRATPAEHAEVKASAAAAGVTPSEFMRSRVLVNPAKRPARITRQPRADVVALARVLGALNKTGGNIHQLVKRVNFGETPAGEEIRAALADYRQVVTEIMTAMGRGAR
jgi:hypothetical protein